MGHSFVFWSKRNKVYYVYQPQLFSGLFIVQDVPHVSADLSLTCGCRTVRNRSVCPVKKCCNMTLCFVFQKRQASSRPMAPWITAWWVYRSLKIIIASSCSPIDCFLLIRAGRRSYTSFFFDLGFEVHWYDRNVWSCIITNLRRECVYVDGGFVI